VEADSLLAEEETDCRREVPDMFLNCGIDLELLAGGLEDLACRLGITAASCWERLRCGPQALNP